MANEDDEALQLNRALWDRLADLHAPGWNEGGHYDVAGFRAGRTSLTQIVLDQLAAVGTIDGRDLLHLQCHFGLDTLSLARLGARVTGVDFSATALDHARQLAETSGLEATFVEADAQRLPPELDDRFDVVFASYGALCWIADLAAWFAGVSRALRPAGVLVVVDIHPLFLMVDSTDPLQLAHPYHGGVPHHDQWEGSYAGAGAQISQPTVGYPHGLGEIVSAAAGAGLRIDHLGEHLEEENEPRAGVLSPTATGGYRLSLGGQDLPVTFSLRASRR